MERVTAQTQTDADRIARRYPRSRTPRWLWVVFAAACAVIGGAWLLWSATYGANPAISAKIVSFEVTSDQTVDVMVTTQRPDPSRPAVCTVIVQAESYDTVGQYPIELGPGTEVLEDHPITVRTFKRGTSASIRSCEAR